MQDIFTIIGGILLFGNLVAATVNGLKGRYDSATYFMAWAIYIRFTIL